MSKKKLCEYLQKEFQINPTYAQLGTIIDYARHEVERCEGCGGSGLVDQGGYMEDCYKCGSSGWIEIEPDTEECNLCEGRGCIVGKDDITEHCENCDGTGEVEV